MAGFYARGADWSRAEGRRQKAEDGEELREEADTFDEGIELFGKAAMALGGGDE